MNFELCLAIFCIADLVVNIISIIALLVKMVSSDFTFSDCISFDVTSRVVSFYR